MNVFREARGYYNIIVLWVVCGLCIIIIMCLIGMGAPSIAIVMAVLFKMNTKV